MPTIKLELEYDQHDLNSFADAVYEATETHFGNDELIAIFHTLPHSIKATAFLAGLSDTVFRDEVFVYLNKNSPQ